MLQSRQNAHVLLSKEAAHGRNLESRKIWRIHSFPSVLISTHNFFLNSLKFLFDSLVHACTDDHQNPASNDMNVSDAVRATFKPPGQVQPEPWSEFWLRYWLLEGCRPPTHTTKYLDRASQTFSKFIDQIKSMLFDRDQRAAWESKGNSEFFQNPIWS